MHIGGLVGISLHCLLGCGGYSALWLQPPPPDTVPSSAAFPEAKPPDNDFDGSPDNVDGRTGATLPPLFWNSWLSDGSDTDLTPVGSLAQDANYVITLDLAGIDYARIDPKVQSALPSNEVRAQIVEDAGTSRFEVLMLADPRYFERVGQSPWEGDLQAQMADIEHYSGDVVGSPFGGHADPAPSYRFGQLRLRFRTKTILSVPVRTQLDLSIWHRDRPIDTVEVPVCIRPKFVKDACKAAAWTAPPASTAWFDDAAPADASLQLVGRGDERIWSVFRRQGDSLKSATKWIVSGTGESALRQSIEHVLKTMERAPSDRLPSLGGTMLSALFPNNAVAARKVVEGALRSMIKDRPPGAARPTLLVKTPSSTLIPFGLAAVSVGADWELLGSRFAIEMPLAGSRDRDPKPATCDLSWISVLPPDLEVKQGGDETMVAVRERLAQYPNALLRRWDAPLESSCAFSKIEEFGDWMAQGESGATRAGLMLVSHHASGAGKDQLYFSTNQSDAVPPEMLRRRFADGSLAILNACGTGGASALGFLATLNGLGFQSIVATATEVEAPLAGDFTFCLAQQISENPVPIGAVFDATIQCLSDLNDHVHGARALTYTLLGDRDATICAQPKDKPCTSYH